MSTRPKNKIILKTRQNKIKGTEKEIKDKDNENKKKRKITLKIKNKNIEKKIKNINKSVKDKEIEKIKIIFKTKKKKENKKNSKKDNTIQNDYNKNYDDQDHKDHEAYEEKHNYTKYYPSILDTNFSKSIANHNIFKKYKLTTDPKKLKSLYNAFETNKSSVIALSDESRKKMSSVYILKPTQKLLRNFMSPYTPYRSLLIYHEMGVGKTCTAITIAESLKSIVKNSNTKIYVIRPDEIVRQVFDINAIRNGKPNYQCTGDTYIKNQNPNFQELLENCSIKGNEHSCDQLKTKVDKEIKQIYEFTGSKSWAYSVLKELNMKTKGMPEGKEKEDKIRQIISNKFNNSVIIVDEAHELHSNDSQTKIVPPVLNKVLKYSSNLRLIFLTATPIYDKPQNIISIINYFLINDKREPLKENDIFDINGNLKEGSRKILEDSTRGYISYLRGNNPYEFPIRLSAKYNIPEQMLDLNNYPKKDAFDKKLSKEDRIKYLDLVDCPLQKQQLEILNYHIKNNKIPDLSENDLDKYLENDPEFIYPSSDDENSTIFESNKYENENEDEDDDSNVYVNSNVKEEKLNKKKKLTLKLKSKKKNAKYTAKSIAKSTMNLIHIDEEHQPLPTKAVAYQLERQLNNFVFQSLEECNKNVKFTSGTTGLNQIATKQHGKWTYEFNNPEYGKRFKLPELYNWGAKIGKVLERVMKSTGRVFIYTGFIDSGIIPIAFALEMNGYRRYGPNIAPILENKYKDQTYRGDYIIYTGTQSQSMYAKDYLDKGSDMIKETNVKVFIGTSKASQGLNLFGYREVHIIDPWHNINLIEQSIGRAIRNGSHLHLPPQERNVTVYQYATTMGDKESFDLKIYKICENKAVKAGIIEKILKENAFDCELNKDVNFYDVKTYGNKIPLITSNNKNIMVSLADAEYSRSCFYMKDCNFKCSDGSRISRSLVSNKYSNTPIMRFNYEKDVEEYKNLIIQLIQNSFNLKIDNLKQYLKNINKSISDDDKDETLKKDTEIHELTLDDDIFNTAIQDIINTDLIITDRLGRRGKISLSGEYLRFIPEGNLDPNISIQKQQMKQPNIFSQIDLKEYISTLDEKQKNVIEFEIKNYDEILSKALFNKTEEIFYNVNDKDYNYNVKLKFEEILEIVFSKLLYSLKVIIIKTLLEKIIEINNNDEKGFGLAKGKDKTLKLTENEKKLEPIISKHIIYMKDVYHDAKQNDNPIKNIYGFIIQNEAKLELFYLNNNNVFEKTLGNITKIIEYKKQIMSKTPYSQLYGFLKYEKKNSEPVFKITDIISKGDKKSVRGLTCRSKKTSEIKKTLNKLDDRLIRSGIKYQSIPAFCNDVEVLLRRNDLLKKNGKNWFYSPEEHYIFFEYGN